MYWIECGIESGVWTLRWRGDVYQRQPGAASFSVSLSAEEEFTLGLDRHREAKTRGFGCKQ